MKIKKSNGKRPITVVDVMAVILALIVFALFLYKLSH